LKSIRPSPRLQKNIEDAGLLSKVGDALEVIPKLGGKFDLWFIDVNKEEYLAPDPIELSNRIV
jgi:predicted O-methyltransferase YrrM